MADLTSLPALVMVETSETVTLPFQSPSFPGSTATLADPAQQARLHHLQACVLAPLPQTLYPAVPGNLGPTTIFSQVFFFYRNRVMLLPYLQKSTWRLVP